MGSQLNVLPAFTNLSLAKYYISFKNLWTEALIREKSCVKAKLFVPSRATEDGLAGLEFRGFFFCVCLLASLHGPNSCYTYIP